MSSLLTNVSALAASRALGTTQTSLAAVETQISTGLRVSSAKDDAAYWSIASSMSTRVGQLKAVDDNLDLTSGIVSTTTAALTNILGMVQRMSNLVVSAQAAGVDVAAVQTEIGVIQKSIVTAANAATFNGVNWLVTKVVGTNTTSDTRVDDVTYAQDLDLSSSRATGVEHEGATYTVNENVTRTLGSTSASINQQQNYVLFTLTGTSVGGIDTTNTTATNQSFSSSVSGDPTGYQIGQIPISISADGSVAMSSQDFHTGELFQSFSGTSTSSYHDTFTDQVQTSSTPAVQQASASPYVTGGQDDVLDTPFLSSSGITSILQFVLANAGDAALASSAINTAIGGITNAMAFYGGLQNEVDGSKRINSTIIDALTSGIGSLVDADMNEDSTKLSALQTQQQIGIQSLSVANDNARAILKLFGS